MVGPSVPNPSQLSRFRPAWLWALLSFLLIVHREYLGRGVDHLLILFQPGRQFSHLRGREFLDSRLDFGDRIHAAKLPPTKCVGKPCSQGTQGTTVRSAAVSNCAGRSEMASSPTGHRSTT